MPVRIRPLKLGSRCRDILSCRRHFAVSAAWCCRIRRLLWHYATGRHRSKDCEGIAKRDVVRRVAWRSLIGQNVLGNLRQLIPVRFQPRRRGCDACHEHAFCQKKGWVRWRDELRSDFLAHAPERAQQYDKGDELLERHILEAKRCRSGATRGSLAHDFKMKHEASGNRHAKSPSIGWGSAIATKNSTNANAYDR